MKFKSLTALGATLFLAASLSACDTLSGITGTTDTGNTGNNTGNTKTGNSTGSTNTGNTGTSTGNNTSGSSGWALAAEAPCSDKATMWWDSTDKGFWGCGQAGTEGLSTTTDGGKTWIQQKKFGGIKVQSITRAPNGTLYIGGENGDSPVVKVDESSPDKLDYTELYTRGNNGFTSLQQAENVAVTSDGQILAESLTGTKAAYFPGNNAAGKAWYDKYCANTKDKSEYNPIENNTWCEVRGVGEERLDDASKGVYQITALQAVNDKFYATGRYIADPAHVRLPSKRSDGVFHFQSIQLQKNNEAGEMYDLKVWENGRIVTVGTDQERGAFMPLIYLCQTGSDCYNPSNWQDIELDDHGFDYPDSARDGRAVDGAGDNIVVVGNFVPNAKGGWAVHSADGGKTWKDLTPTLKAISPKGKLENLYNVKVFNDGKIMLFGDDNYIYTP